MTGSLIVFVHEGKIQRTNKHSHLRKQCVELVFCLKIKKMDGNFSSSLTVLRKTTKAILETKVLNVCKRGSVLMCSIICQGLETIHT